MIPILNNEVKDKIEAEKDIILSEINVKTIEYITEDAGFLVKKIKPNFKLLGKKHGKQMKLVAAGINKFNQDDIRKIEVEGKYILNIDNNNVEIELSEVEILSEDIPGWLVATNSGLTVALDITITDELKEEGIAREFINRIQNLRKDLCFEVTDKINLKIQKHDEINNAIENYKKYISTQTLTNSLLLSDDITEEVGTKFVEISDTIQTKINITKI